MARSRSYILPLLLSSALHAQNGTVTGDWQEPGGSILRVFSCGAEVCMRIMKLRPDTPHLNTHDPDVAKRTQPLCDLQIGYGFKPQGSQKAIDGRVYDPESGKTYHGEMHSADDVLHLRGYILFPALGRTEKWKRVVPLAEACHDR